jgi:hypothetical protein
VEFVSGPWRITSVLLARGDDRPREYLRIYFHGYHVSDVRTVEEVATVLAAHGLALSDLAKRDRSRLRWPLIRARSGCGSRLCGGGGRR